MKDDGEHRVEFELADNDDIILKDIFQQIGGKNF